MHTEEAKELPTWENVEEYANKKINSAVYSKCSNLPYEIQEDIKQEAWIRVWRHFDKLVPGKSWKAFISTHCNGAVLDFLKSNRGLHELKTGATTMKSRVRMYSEDGSEFGVDHVLGAFGIYADAEHDKEQLDIKWDLVQRLAAEDDRVLILAKHIVGVSYVDIASQSKFCRERVGQQCREIINHFSSPESEGDKWTEQVLYAFGLSDLYGTPNEDNGFGWQMEPVDIFSDTSTIANNKFRPQMEMF